MVNVKMRFLISVSFFFSFFLSFLLKKIRAAYKGSFIYIVTRMRVRARAYLTRLSETEALINYVPKITVQV